MSDLPVSAAVGRRANRFWITVAIFALLNAGAWVGYHAWLQSQKPRADILMVQEFAAGEAGGAGEGEILSDDPVTLSWTFNLDVAKPGKVTPGPKGEMPGMVQPPINGEWLWTDARTLTFEAHERLPRATKFTATLHPAVLKTPEGYTLAKPVANTFSTVPLQLKTVKQVAFEGDSRILLEIEFNDKVIPGEVLRHLKVEGPDERQINVTLQGQGAGPIVRVLTDSIPIVPVAHPISGASRPGVGPNTLLVTVTPGLTGASGPLGLVEPQHRLVAIANVLLAERLEASLPTEGPAALTLSFNNQLKNNEDFERIRPLISVEPEMAFEIERSSDRYIRLTGDFQPATRYTVTIAKASQADDPRIIPRPATLSVFVPDRQATAYFEHSTGYLGSKGNRTLLVKTVNVPAIRVRAERVYENNLVAWRNARSYYGEPPTAKFSRPAGMKRYVLANKKNMLQDLRIDLNELLGKEADSEGVFAIEIATEDGNGNESTADDERYWSRRHRYGGGGESTSVVTLSDIGLTSKIMASPTNPATEKAMLAWAVSLSTGKPRENVKVRVYSDKNQLLGEGVSDAHGVARVDHLNPAEGETPKVVIAEEGKSLTWLDLTSARRDESELTTAGKPYLRNGYEAFVWPERGVYRPGETVVLRAIVRGSDMSTPPEKLPVRWQIRRPDGRDWQSKSVALDADGAAEWRVTFPADAQTGYWSAHLGLPGTAGAGSSGMRIFGRADFQVEEFLPDRMKIALTLSGSGITKDGGRLATGKQPLLADVQTDYLFGQPAAGLQSQLTARISPAPFTAKRFATSDGWLSGDTAKVGEVRTGAQPPAGDNIEPITQTLDKSGHTQFEVALQKKLGAGAAPADESTQQGPLAPSEIYIYRGPWRINVTANTTEIGGRAVTAYAATEADLLPYYLMVRASATNGYLPTAQPANFEIALVKPSGEQASATTTIQTNVFAESWNNSLTLRDGRYRYESHRVLQPVKDSAGSLKIDGAAVQFSWTPKNAGTYVLEFVDVRTKQATTLRITAGQEGGWSDNISRSHPERVEVQIVAADSTASPQTTDKNSPLFTVGQNVKAIVRSPFAGQLLLTVETDTVLWSKVIDMPADKPMMEVPLTLPEGVRPNGYIAATVIRAVEPNKQWRTHRAFGLARFAIDSSDRKLAIKIAAPTELRPLKTLDVELTVLDAKGNPAPNAAIALAAVDEGILRVTSYNTPNPLAFYNGVRSLGIESSDLYGMLMPEIARLDGESKVGGGGEGDDDFAARHSTPVTAKRVRPVSLVSDIVRTDAAGKATVHLNVPEFLGKLRIMAVSYSGPLMGSADAETLVRSPLVVQSSFPRFLAPGDSATVSLLMINNSASAGTVTTKLTTSSADVLAFDTTGGGVPEVVLNPGEQKIVTTKLIAKGAVGVSAISLEAKLGDETFTESLEIPVRPASPTISRGAYATVTPDKPLVLEIPRGLLAGTENFELRVGQRPALGLPEGLSYLNRYPYGCLEQTTSQCFPLVYLGDIGKSIAPGVFEEQSVARKIQFGILRLVGMQTASGGLAMWNGSDEDWSWGTVYAAHFLIEAEKAGHTVPEDFKVRLMAYLRSLLTASAQTGEQTQVQAYAAYVTALAGKPDRAVLNRLGEILDSARSDSHRNDSQLATARFHLALAWSAAGRHDLAQKMIPQAMPAFPKTRQLAGNLASPIRDEALQLTTLLGVSPDHAAIAPLVDRLSNAGKRGEWRSTQDNAFAVMALGKYLRATKDEQPFDAAELLDGDKILTSSDAKNPLVWSARDLPANLTIRIKGEAGAKGHVSWLQHGVPLEMPAAADNSLKIRRTYLTEDDRPLDVRSLVSGAAVKVRVTVDAPSALSNVVIEDLIPAGLEIENARLATALKTDGDTPVSRTISAQKMDVRDDRAVVVTHLPAGISTWTYLARAVTPGEYIIPPVRGECMYDPAINSIHGGGERMIVRPVEKKTLAIK